MLYAYALALRALGRDAEAAAASTAALGLPSDDSVADHRRWLALDSALDGRDEQSDDLLRGPEPDPNDIDADTLHGLISLVTTHRRRADSGSEKAFREARDALVALTTRRPSIAARPALRRARRRVAWHLAAQRGTLGARL